MANENQNNPGSNFNRNVPKSDNVQADKNKQPVEKDPKNSPPKIRGDEQSSYKKN